MTSHWSICTHVFLGLSDCQFTQFYVTFTRLSNSIPAFYFVCTGTYTVTSYHVFFLFLLFFYFCLQVISHVIILYDILQFVAWCMHCCVIPLVIFIYYTDGVISELYLTNLFINSFRRLVLSFSLNTTKCKKNAMHCTLFYKQRIYKQH